MKDEAYLKMLGTAVWESPVPIYIIHVEVDEAGKPVDWRFAYANEAEARHLSTPLEKLLGSSGIELLPKIGEKWLLPYYKAAYLEKTLDFDTFAQRTKRYIHLHIMPAGTPGYCIASIKNFEKTLHEELEPGDPMDQTVRHLVREKAILESLCLDYTAIYFADLKTDTMEVVKQGIFSHSLDIEEALPAEKKFSYRARIAYLRDHLLVKESCGDFYGNLGSEGLMRHLTEKETFTYRARTHGNREGNEYFELKAIRVHQDEAHFQIVIGLRPIDDLVREEGRHQRRLEEALASERRSNEVISAISKIYWVIYLIDLEKDTCERIAAVGEGYQASGKVYAASRAFDDLLKDIVSEEYHGSMRAFVDTRTLAMRLSQEDTITTTYRSRTGEWRQARFIVKIRDEKGRAKDLLYMVNPIDRAKQKEMQYQAVMNALGQDFAAIFLTDLRQDTIEMIRGMEDTHLGLTLENVHHRYSEWIRYACEHLVYEENREEMALLLSAAHLERELLQHKMYSVRCHVHPNPAGNEYFEVRAVLSQQDENHFEVIMGYRPLDQVIREERMNQQRLEEALHQVELANEAKSAFLFNMSHDIRTPMNAILGFSSLLRMHKEEPEKILDYTEKIEKSGEYLLSLINNVLELSRIESGKSQLDEAIIDTKELNDAVCYLFENQMKAKQISFTRTLRTTHRFIYADKVKLQEILLNLLSNACKYTPPGGKVSFDVCSAPSQEEGVELFTSTIRDNGIGMTKEFLAHIFEAFTRARSSTESRQPGFGLGMGIAKKLTELMGGTITVESEPGKGTTFTVSIPHRIAKCPEKEFYAEQSVLPDTVLQGRRILLAEDNDLNAEIAEELLKDAGLLVERARDGIECLAMLEKKKAGWYDLILMDIQMPNMDGYKATTIIRRLEDPELSKIPIIAMTANAFAEDKAKAIALGMNAHVAKPIDMKVLKRVMENVLGKS